MKSKIWQFIKLDLQYYIFILLVFVIPLTKKYLPYFVFLWVLSGFISIRKVNRESVKNIILLLFPLLFFSIHAIGLFYSNNFESGLFDLEVKLSIFFIPVVSIFITDKVQVNYRLILKLFVFGNLLASITCLVLALYKSISFNELGDLIFESSNWPTVTQGLGFFQLINHRYSFFSYSFLSVFHHPSYFSVYIIFSIAILVYLIRSSKKKHIMYYGIIVYFTIFIWLLGSRAGYITYLISFFSFILIVILKFKKYWIGIGAIGIGAIFGLIVLSNGQIIKNIKETTNILENTQSLNKDSDIRLRLWKSAFEVFKDNLWFGVGIGDLDQEMSRKYEQYNLDLEKEHIYNPHNQYLTEAAKLGLVGLLIFTGWIITVLIITAKRKQFLFFYFMLIFAINLFFESMLNLIAGIAYFAFFYSLLYAMYNIASNKKQIQDT